MPKKAEIIYSIQNDRPSITIHLAEEGNATHDLHGMLSQIQEAITEFQARPQTRQLSSSEVEVQDISRASPPAREEPSPDSRWNTSQQNNALSHPPKKDTSSPGTISKKQAGLIHVNLKAREISEKDFCAKHGVDCVENLSGKMAWIIIKKEQY